MYTEAYNAHTDTLTAECSPQRRSPRNIPETRSWLALMWTPRLSVRAEPEEGNQNNVTFLVLLSHVWVCEPYGCVGETPFRGGQFFISMFNTLLLISSTVINVIKTTF